MYDQEVESCDFGHEDCSAARVQEEVADVEVLTVAVICEKSLLSASSHTGEGH